MATNACTMGVDSSGCVGALEIAGNYMNNLTNKSGAELRERLQASRQTLTALIERLADRPDMQNAILRLMRPDDMLETVSELAVKEPDLMRLFYRQAWMSALPVEAYAIPNITLRPSGSATVTTTSSVA